MSGYWSGKNVLVTGADGFIGSHLVESLVGYGARVRAFVYYNSFDSWGWLDDLGDEIKNELEVFPGDVRDEGRVREAVKGVDVVFHLASLIAIPYSYHAPESYVHTNVGGTLHVLKACLEHGVERMVHTSTSEVYGTAQYVPIDEKHPLRAQSPYAASKIGADMLVESFHRSFGLPTATARPFNTYGPRQSARAVIPTIISQLVSGERRIKLGAIRPTRDFNYVTDTAAGFLAVGRCPEAVGRTINLGSGEEIAIGDLAELLFRITGVDGEIECEEERLRPAESEVDRLMCDASMARELCGWQPEVSLEEGLRRTARWIADHPETYRPRRYTI
ncbi:MAG: SDR family NAD(P)-dependent oxidoreductase [Deltaproteobacteria bacterium]|nr:SDR family NAD(P)-dependent oxidoreductase [Deltaproteobacteria bacterium]MBW1924266.1 SDR family NAD(P)-dependent oxidoreductase [Deltaproteobacteria bacterium]